MQSKDLPAARAELESEMRQSLTALMDFFKSRSGIGVGAIDIHFVDARTIADPCEVMVISSVDVELSL
ncbi:hypothetical protein [Pseudomonas sp. S9]|uniref:hypothetical protein n=1 Tax=Pseudomonas sp. S9 TaxID=686578 RepID=UPI0002556F52|nr:hypothetical protein [Pseudomonas sp. S9]